MRCAIHNPTRGPRIIHDGIEGSQKPIRIEPGETVDGVVLAQCVIDRLRSIGNDLVVMLADTSIVAPAPIVMEQKQRLVGPVSTAGYPLFIEIPAWGRYYVDLATKYTIPAVLASLAGSGYADVTFFVHTDDRAAFEAVLPGQKIRFFAMKIATRANHHPQQDPLPKHSWAQFMEAHREAIAATPSGGLVVLLNSDIVVSVETFASVNRIFSDPNIKVGSSVGVRTLIDDATPPLGVDFDTLAQWAWDHKHEITKQSVWDKGRIIHTSHLYFEQGDHVVMHCFHLTPMFIRKDRDLSFKGTIDDDLMQMFGDDEIYYMNNREAFFAELSPGWKKHSCGTALSVSSVVNFGRRKFSKAHVRNFARCYPVVGPAFAHPAVGQIFNNLTIAPAIPTRTVRTFPVRR